MDFITAIKSSFVNYVTLGGRAPRSEYWYFFLFLLIGGLVTSVLDAILLPASVVSPLNAIFTLVTFLPWVALSVRRLHDIDKAGWWFLLWLLPVIGWIVIVIWHAQRGSRGANRFGLDSLPSVAAMPA